MSQKANNIEIEENEKIEAIALKPIRGATGKYYPCLKYILQI